MGKFGSLAISHVARASVSPTECARARMESMREPLRTALHELEAQAVALGRSRGVAATLVVVVDHDTLLESSAHALALGLNRLDGRHVDDDGEAPVHIAKPAC